jgi:hypothetical protein
VCGNSLRLAPLQNKRFNRDCAKFVSGSAKTAGLSHARFEKFHLKWESLLKKGTICSNCRRNKYTAAFWRGSSLDFSTYGPFSHSCAGTSRLASEAHIYVGGLFLSNCCRHGAKLKKYAPRAAPAAASVSQRH